MSPSAPPPGQVHARLHVPDFYFRASQFCPEFAPADVAQALEMLTRLEGQFSFVRQAHSGSLLLARDRIGANKLFFAIHESGRTHVATFLDHLLSDGVPLEAVYSVPAGHLMEIHPQQKTLSLHRYAQIRPGKQAGDASLEECARGIRNQLEQCFSRLAQAFASRTVCLCLSGGLDSGVVAAMARKHFPQVRAYTYGFESDGKIVSEDAEAAQQLAAHLGIPLRLVPATAADIQDAVDAALLYGQDWRDFNVHCAIVNHLIARAVAADARQWPQPPLLLTGDLMNEYLADYSPVRYGDREFYTLPKLKPADLRFALIRGLDVGDREIGVFNRHGLHVVQPYVFLLQNYLELPGAFVGEAGSKQTLMRAVAGDLLPAFVFERKKVRAQIGSSRQPVGILPCLVDAGRDSAWLRGRFCQLLGLTDSSFLERFIIMGTYRSLSRFPAGERTEQGFLRT